MKKKDYIDISTPMKYHDIKFIETPIFMKFITELMDDDNYRLLQTELIMNPEKGAVIVGGGGIRKIRWSLGKDKGKSSGVRIIYYYKSSAGLIFMLLGYSKKMATNLSKSQIKQLRIKAKELQNEKEIYE